MQQTQRHRGQGIIPVDMIPLKNAVKPTLIASHTAIFIAGLACALESADRK